MRIIIPDILVGIIIIIVVVVVVTSERHIKGPTQPEVLGVYPSPEEALESEQKSPNHLADLEELPYLDLYGGTMGPRLGM